MERRDSELTFDERKALQTDVFSKLTCQHWLIRFLKLVIPSLILIISCSGIQPVPTDKAIQQSSIFTSGAYLAELNEELHISDNVSDFESNMPDNAFLLSSLVSFDKKKLPLS